MSTPERLASHHWCSDHCDTDVARCRHSRKSAAATFSRSMNVSSGAVVVTTSSRSTPSNRYGRSTSASSRLKVVLLAASATRQRDDDDRGERGTLRDRSPRVEQVARQARPPARHRCRARRSRSIAPAACGGAVAPRRSAPRCRRSAASASASRAPRPTRRTCRACSSRRSPMIDSRCSRSRTTIDSSSRFRESVHVSAPGWIRGPWPCCSAIRGWRGWPSGRRA